MLHVSPPCPISAVGPQQDLGGGGKQRPCGLPHSLSPNQRAAWGVWEGLEGGPAPPPPLGSLVTPIKMGEGEVWVDLWGPKPPPTPGYPGMGGGLQPGGGPGLPSLQRGGGVWVMGGAATCVWQSWGGTRGDAQGWGWDQDGAPSQSVPPRSCSKGGGQCPRGQHPWGGGGIAPTALCSTSGAGHGVPSPGVCVSSPPPRRPPAAPGPDPAQQDPCTAGFLYSHTPAQLDPSKAPVLHS